MRHLSKQIFESFFRRLTEYRQKGRIHNATYETGVIVSFHGKSADVVKLLPVYSDDCLCHCFCEIIRWKTSGGAWICHHSSVYCSGISQNPEGVLPFCIYFIQTRCKSVFGEGQTVVGCENGIVGDFDVFSFPVDILPSGVLSMGESHKIECRQKTIFLCRPIYDG